MNRAANCSPTGFQRFGHGAGLEAQAVSGETLIFESDPVSPKTTLHEVDQRQSQALVRRERGESEVMKTTNQSAGWGGPPIRLTAGGAFTTAGGKVSGYAARAIVFPRVLAIEPDGSGGYFINFSGVPGSAYRSQRAPGVRGPWTSSGPYTAPASGFLEFWDVFPPPGRGFYRSEQP
jgi:hypothetical protein